MQEQNSAIAEQNKKIIEQNEIIIEQNKIIFNMLKKNNEPKSQPQPNPAFISPKWPINKTKNIEKLNRKLEDEEYKQQVVCRLKGFWNNLIIIFFFQILSDCRNKHILFGANIRGTVKKIMEKIFAYKALIKYSWSGKTFINSNGMSCLNLNFLINYLFCQIFNFSEAEKRIFSRLEAVIQLIIDIVGQQNANKIIEEALKYFMKRVPQRYAAIKS